jgi:DNA-binding protein HU-beta
VIRGAAAAPDRTIGGLADVVVSSTVDSFGPHNDPKKEQNVTKSEFVDQVAGRADLGKSEAGKAVDAVLDVIQETLQRGSDVTFSGFGKFHVAERGARQGVHPRTGEPIQISASKVPRFSAGSGLKKAVNG